MEWLYDWVDEQVEEGVYDKTFNTSTGAQRAARALMLVSQDPIVADPDHQSFDSHWWLDMENITGRESDWLRSFVTGEDFDRLNGIPEVIQVEFPRH